MQFPFTGRQKQLADIANLIDAGQGAVYALQGAAGTGKSVLLKQLAAIHADKSLLAIDLTELPPVQTAVECLLFAAQNAQGLEKTQEALVHINHAYKTTARLIEPYKVLRSESTVLAVAKPSDEIHADMGVFAELAKGLLHLFNIWSKRKPKVDKEKLADPELYLLDALKQDCQTCPLVLVDAYECLLAGEASTLQSINSQYSRLHETLDSRGASIVLPDWFERFLVFLQKQGAVVIVAGRRVAAWDKQAYTLEGFDKPDLLTLAAGSSHSSIQQAAAEYPAELIKVLSLLSFNRTPLWLVPAIGVVRFLLDTGKNLSDLATMRDWRDCLECSESVSGLAYVDIEHADGKSALLQHVMQHGANLADKVWPLALPRRLNQAVLNVLFGDHASSVCDTLVKAGFLSENPLITESVVRLHEEFRVLLLAYAGRMQWLEGDQVKAIHRKLSELYGQRYRQQHKVQDLLEQLYHQFMADDAAGSENVHDGHILHKLALDFEREGQYSKMRQVFLCWRDADPENAIAWSGLAIALRLQGRLTESVEAYRKLVAIRPNHGDAWYQLGDEFRVLGRLHEAELAFRKQVEIKPDHTESWYELGRILADQERQEEAEHAFRHLVRLKPNDEWSWYHFGRALAEQGRQEEAEHAFRKQVKIQPNHEIAWYSLGVALAKQGRQEEAEQAYRRQVEIKPKHEWAWSDLGHALRKQGRLEEAEQAYRRQVEIKADHQSAWNSLGYVLMKQGDLAPAQQAYAQALHLKPNSISALCGDAELALVQNDIDRCLTRVAEGLRHVSNINRSFAVLPFWAWLAQSYNSYRPVLVAISQLDPGTEMDWDFSGIEIVLLRLMPEQQQVAQCFIDYFSGKIDHETLVGRLNHKNR